jgi:hypothetical protein
MVAAVRDDPVRRLELAARFYDRRIGRVSIRSYRRAEMAFMRWQVRRGAEVFLSLRNILPYRYPLDGVTVHEILDAENYLGRLVDYGVIMPRARALYAHAATELNEPQLLEMLRDGWPVYAWPYDQRHVWTTTKAPLAIRTLTKLTANTDTDQPGRARQGECG